MRTKDNMTDLLESLPKDTPVNPVPDQPPQQVTGSNGEVITLEQIANLIKTKLLELLEKHFSSKKDTGNR